MNVTKAIAGRRSTRDYTPEPVDEKLIFRLIDAAAQAPSAMNQQPWTFTVIRDQALLERTPATSKRCSARTVFRFSTMRRSWC